MGSTVEWPLLPVAFSTSFSGLHFFSPTAQSDQQLQQHKSPATGSRDPTTEVGYCKGELCWPFQVQPGVMNWPQLQVQLLQLGVMAWPPLQVQLGRSLLPPQASRRTSWPISRQLVPLAEGLLPSELSRQNQMGQHRSEDELAGVSLHWVGQQSCNSQDENG